MQYWWRGEINSSTAELISVAALQIAELLLVNSDFFDSVRRTDRSTELLFYSTGNLPTMFQNQNC